MISTWCNRRGFFRSPPLSKIFDSLRSLSTFYLVLFQFVTYSNIGLRKIRLRELSKRLKVKNKKLNVSKNTSEKIYLMSIGL